MSRESIVFIVGILIIIAPYLGVPEAWKVYFFTGVGVLLMVIGYSLRRTAYLRSLEEESGERRADSYVEHVNHS